MFRSEPMQHGALILPVDRAREFIELLGKHCHMQFVDMNEHSLKRQYRRYIQRIDEMERILRLLFEKIESLHKTRVIPADVDAFMEPRLDYQLDSVESALQKLSEQFQRFRENNSVLIAEKNTAVEEMAVVRAAQASYTPGGSGGSLAVGGMPEGTTTSLAQADDIGGPAMGRFTNVAGMIPTSEQEKFARTLFRATRGNAFTHFEPIPESWIDAETGKPTQKSVFVTYFQGTSTGTSALREKIMRICGAYGVNIYDWPKSHAEAQERAGQLEHIIADKATALDAYEQYIIYECSALLEPQQVGGGSLIEEYRLFCLKEKAIYATLNLFKDAETNLFAYCWFPATEEETIRRLLLSHSSTTQVSAFLLTDQHNRVHESPPTYIRTTAFTDVFQTFVNTYGIPRYQELNPAVLTTITFPFLFGIMYGDIGHGACLFALSLYLVLAYNKLKGSKDEMVQMISGGRYMMLLMSVFAVYAGVLYNDFFALPLDFFGTRYKQTSVVGSDIRFSLKNPASPYPFGFDPIWKGATNELTFLNSFKMKFSVIVGGIQMVVGIMMKIFNAIHFRDTLTLCFEAIPQLIFMLAFVGFMDFLIIFKWATPISVTPSNKPSIISNIIEMCMFSPIKIRMFSGQETVHKVCIILMLLSLPAMLLIKPIALLIQHKRKKARGYEAREQVTNEDCAVAIYPVPAATAGALNDDDEEHEEEFEFGEISIHQMIETIEFCLGTLSNTASYLRLWALSLAHQQLSLVFFQLIILRILKLDLNEILLGIALFFAFAAFAAVTFGVMLCMDTLECFLHALRLQWVEFQNKFYKGDGYAFVPFRFKSVFTAEH